MCIAVFMWKSDPRFPFLLLLNRDEFYSRATTPLGWWDDGVTLGGRDAEAGGTWLACTRAGRLAFLTNVREVKSDRHVKTRGELPVRFLKSEKNPRDFAEELVPEAKDYSGFNLIVADLSSLTMVYISNRSCSSGLSISEVSPGVHVLSNAELDTPWPKVARGGCKRAELGRWSSNRAFYIVFELGSSSSRHQRMFCSRIELSTSCSSSTRHRRMFFSSSHVNCWIHFLVLVQAQRLLHGFEEVVGKFIVSQVSLQEMAEIVMKDTTKDDRHLPGVYPPEFEYLLSSIFVQAITPSGGYGTRSISAVALSSSNGGLVSVYETCLQEENEEWKKQNISFQIQT